MKLLSRITLVTVLVMFAGTAVLEAQGAYVSTDRFGYTGTIRRYNTLADLLAQTNAVSGSPFAIPARDLGLYMVDGNAAFATPTYANSAMFLSAWYYSGSPSNQNTGFIQMYDIEGGSVSSMNGRWLNDGRTSYQFSVTGGNTVFGGCNTTGDCGRLWNAGSALGSSETTAGIFYSYALSFTATGLTSATWNATTGVWESQSEPTAVFGKLSGIFHNQSATNPASNGWYAFDIDLDMNSWAYENAGDFAPSYFGSAQVVPEPATMILLGSGLAGVAGAVRRRRRQRSED